MDILFEKLQWMERKIVEGVENHESGTNGRRTNKPRRTGLRYIFLGSAIDDNVANVVIAQLLFLSAEDSEKDVHLYINSPGGSVTAGFGILDTMNYIKPDVSTICVGLAASMGSLLLTGGAKGKRFALPNAEVMIHQPLGGVRGQASDIKIHADWILRTKKKINEIYVQQTGQPYDRIERDTDRDNFMDAEEAKAYGLIDEVISQRDLEQLKG